MEAPQTHLADRTRLGGQRFSLPTASSKKSSNTNGSKAQRLMSQVANSRRSLVAQIPRGLGPLIPDAAVVKLNFAHTFLSWNDPTDAYEFGTQVNLRINNAYEPINGEHQPYGWDQIGALYGQYKVIGCKMRLTISNDTSNLTCYTAIRPVPYNEATVLSGFGIGIVAERPRSKVIMTTYGGGKPAVHTMNINIADSLGVTKEQYDADVTTYAATVTTAPSRYSYVQVATAGASLSKGVEVMVEIEYIVQFWQRTTQAVS